jgi:hypothetical protein
VSTFKEVPDRDEFAADVNESLIVELYSALISVPWRHACRAARCASPTLSGVAVSRGIERGRLHADKNLLKPKTINVGERQVANRAR